MVLFAGRVAHSVTVERTVKTVDGHKTAIWVIDDGPRLLQRSPHPVPCVGRIRSRAAVFFVNVRDPVLVSVDGLLRLYGTVLTVPGAQDCRR